ncbi:MAG: NIPSNAP family protein [Burkholderiaceae bacterium]|nr:NIPSNAP family protein [Burkholderiaceae bacterium]
MIYQHRLIVARSGRLEKRNEVFEREMLSALDGHGSVLIGAWEVLMGPDAGSAVYQLRQFDSLAAWEQHQERVRLDRQHKGRQANLYPSLDAVDTAIVRLAERSPQMAATWPSVDALRDSPRGFFEQRFLHLRPDSVQDHHALYFDEVLPALKCDGVTLAGLFDTVIGPGSMNAGSHRSIELRRFADLATWQRWREAQDNDPALRRLVRERWAPLTERVDSLLLRPLPYSRMR